MPTLLAFRFLIVFLLISSFAFDAQTKTSARGEFTTLAARADAERDADRLQEATALYHKALALRPRWAEGWWSLGTIAYDQNSYEEAAHSFQKVIELSPQNGTAYVMLGLAEFELGREELSLKHIQKGANLGLDKDPSLRNVALYHEGLVLQRQGRFQAARETLDQLCLKEVESDGLIKTMGMVLLRMRSKDAPPAETADAGVVSSVGRAGCLAGQKKFDDARKEMDAAVARHPNYPAIHYAFGLVLTAASDSHAADMQFKEEIKNNPDDIFSRLQLAVGYYKVDSAVGIRYAEEVVKINPKVPFAHYVLGLLYLDTDKYQKAIPALEIAAKAFPKESKVFFALGSAYSRAGRRQDAARARATFERLNKQFPEASGPSY